MTPSSDYKRAYDSAKQELADLLVQQERVEQRLIVVRKNVQSLAEICANEGIEIEPSEEAVSLLEDSALADEIRILLAAHFGVFFRVSWIRDELQRLGHDLSRYSNPQSTIQMVLKRMVQSGDVEEKKSVEDGKYAYAMVTPKWIETARKRATVGMLTGESGTSLDATPLPANHPLNKIKARKPPLTPGEARKMMESLRAKK
jgi:hypothetical protein